MNSEKIEQILAKGETIEKTNDFKSWKLKDMSELFWQHLTLYVKEPNYHSLKLMERAWLWAVHDDNALANSFAHAMKWVGIDDIYEEYERHGW